MEANTCDFEVASYELEKQGLDRGGGSWLRQWTWLRRVL